MKRLRWYLLASAFLFTACPTQRPLEMARPMAAVAPPPKPAPVATPAVPWDVPIKPLRWIQFHNNAANDDDGLIAGVPNPLRLCADQTCMTEPVLACSTGNRINYLAFMTGGRNIAPYTRISATIGVTGKNNPKFVFWSPSNNCLGPTCDPVSAKLMLWGPDGGADSTTNRWFAFTQPIVLTPGVKATISMPLAGAGWEGVFGQNPATPAGAPPFLATKRATYAIAIVFGGGYYQGHGTCVKDGPGVPPASASVQVYRVWFE